MPRRPNPLLRDRQNWYYDKQPFRDKTEWMRAATTEAVPAAWGTYRGPYVGEELIKVPPPSPPKPPPPKSPPPPLPPPPFPPPLGIFGAVWQAVSGSGAATPQPPAAVVVRPASGGRRIPKAPAGSAPEGSAPGESAPPGMKLGRRAEAGGGVRNDPEAGLVASAGAGGAGASAGDGGGAADRSEHLEERMAEELGDEEWEAELSQLHRLRASRRALAAAAGEAGERHAVEGEEQPAGAVLGGGRGLRLFVGKNGKPHDVGGEHVCMEQLVKMGYIKMFNR